MQEAYRVWLPLTEYFLILAAHFGYAAHLIFAKKVSLAVGRISRPSTILVSLLAINGFSLSAFVWPRALWIELNVFYHFVLTVDEILRTKKAIYRWPFLVNHILFATSLIIWLFVS